MRPREGEPWTDEEMLEALEMRADGLTKREIGERMGRKTNGVVGMLSRINEATDKSDPDGNQNGTMPRGWWRR